MAFSRGQIFRKPRHWAVDKTVALIEIVSILTDLAKGSGVQPKQAVRTSSEMALSTTTGAPMQRNSTGMVKVEAMIMASAVVECIFFIKKALDLHLWKFYGE